MTETFDPRAHRARPDELAGRVIAITGASDGLGRAVAIACARHGASVVLIGRSERKLEAVHTEIAAAGGPEAAIGVLDLERALAADYDRLAAALAERYGRLDGLLHNAALLGTLAPIEHYDVPTWCRVLHVNLTAAFALTQVLLPLLKRSADASALADQTSTALPLPDRSRKPRNGRAALCMRAGPQSEHYPTAADTRR